MQSGRVIQRCHNKIPDRGCDQGCEWRHTPEVWAEIWEKSVSWVLPSEEEGWLLIARRGLAAGVHVVWGRWKSKHRKMVSLYLCRITFKLKSNKKFCTWTKKSSVFFMFRDSYVISIYIYICALWTLWTFCVPVWTCLFHIIMYGYVTKTWNEDHFHGHSIHIWNKFWFGLVLFHGISTIIGYLLPNSFLYI